MRVPCAALALAATLLAGIGCAQAGSLRVGPTLIVLDEEHPVAVVRVTNNNALTTAIDVRANAWQQTGNEDRYTDTRHLIVTPAVFDLAAGDTQTVRIGLNPLAVRDAAAVERAFRVFVAELPDQRADASPTQMLMRVGIPVFLGSPNSRADLAWRVTRADASTWQLEAVNRGSAHARLLRLDLQAAGIVPGTELKGAYVLPGATRTWSIPVMAQATTLGEVSLHVDRLDGDGQSIKLIPDKSPVSVAAAR